jgi:hypothetical protein
MRVGEPQSWLDTVVRRKIHSSCRESQEMTCLLWNLTVHFCVHMILPLVPLLSQLNPVHNSSPYFPEIHSNIIFPPTPSSSKWSLPFGFYNQNSVSISHLSHACYVPCSSHTSSTIIPCIQKVTSNLQEATSTPTMEKYNLKELNEVEIKEHYQVEISNRFVALENLNTTMMMMMIWT